MDCCWIHIVATLSNFWEDKNSISGVFQDGCQMKSAVGYEICLLPHFMNLANNTL